VGTPAVEESGQLWRPGQAPEFVHPLASQQYPSGLGLSDYSLEKSTNIVGDFWKTRLFLMKFANYAQLLETTNQSDALRGQV